jgi:hypothetical protein
VVSHSFRKEREKDGAPSILAGIRIQIIAHEKRTSGA